MTLLAHPDILPAVYDFLRTTKPFRGWRLPHSDEIAFKVSDNPNQHGEYMVDGGNHQIEVSAARTGHTLTLIMTMSHEMCHLRQVILGHDPNHGKEFQKMAAIVCRHHGFDPKAF